MLLAGGEQQTKNHAKHSHRSSHLEYQGPGSGCFENVATHRHADDARNSRESVGDAHELASVIRRHVHVVDSATGDKRPDGVADPHNGDRQPGAIDFTNDEQR